MKEYNTYVMHVGESMAGALKAPEKKKYTRIDKRTKKYGNLRRKNDWQGVEYKTKSK